MRRGKMLKLTYLENREGKQFLVHWKKKKDGNDDHDKTLILFLAKMPKFY